MLCCSPFVMVLLGLLGDVHKGNFTWNLKAFDEFQNLPNLPVRFETDFFLPRYGVLTNLVKLRISRQIPINQSFTWNLKAFDEFQNLPNLPVRFETDFSFQDAEF